MRLAFCLLKKLVIYIKGVKYGIKGTTTNDGSQYESSMILTVLHRTQ